VIRSAKPPSVSALYRTQSVFLNRPDNRAGDLRNLAPELRNPVAVPIATLGFRRSRNSTAKVIRVLRAGYQKYVISTLGPHGYSHFDESIIIDPRSGGMDELSVIQ
jgi:hypothetical protein